jgi:hypothetical protein
MEGLASSLQKATDKIDMTEMLFIYRNQYRLKEGDKHKWHFH